MGANYTDTHIYLDGAEVPVTRTNRTFSTLTADLTIGITNDSSTGFSAGHAFDGTVDEVSVYGSKLSDARVAAHWEAGVPALSYPQTLTWDVDEYDGIVNWLGTQGEQTTFANPAWRAGGGSFTTSQSSTIDTVRTSAKATDHRLDANNGSVHTSNSAGEWWKVDFGSGATVTPTRLGIVGRSFGGLHPRNFKLQGSNDDSTWTDLLTVTADGPADGTWWSSAVSGASAYRYLRILQTGTNSGAGLHLTLGEIEVWGTISA